MIFNKRQELLVKNMLKKFSLSFNNMSYYFYNKKQEKVKNIQMVFNGLKTPDGTLIYSNHVNHYSEHLDKISKEYYSVTGGLSYKEISLNNKKPKVITITINHPYKVIRRYYRHPVETKDGTIYVPLKNIPIFYLKKVIDYVNNGEIKIALFIKNILIKEINFRENNK